MKEKKGVWKLKYLESLPEQNDANETDEST
jgi:hypothetical protein